MNSAIITWCSNGIKRLYDLLSDNRLRKPALQVIACVAVGDAGSDSR